MKRGLIVLFLLFLLLIPLISATGDQSLIDRFKRDGFPFLDIDINLTEEHKIYVSNFLVGFVYFLVVFNIVGFLPFFKETWMKFLVSIGVAILGFLFMDQNQINIIIGQYEALAVALTSVLPILLLFMFVFHLETEKRKGKVSASVVNIIILILMISLGVYFTYKIFTVDSTKIIWYGVALVVIIVLFFVKDQLFEKIVSSMIKSRRETSLTRLREGTSDLNSSHRAAGDEIEADS